MATRAKDNAYKPLVLKAIAQRNCRVTIADIVETSGAPANVAGRLLNSIAAETGGHLSVSEDGTILYCFDSNFQFRYITRGVVGFFAKCFRFAFQVLFLLFRISFGLTLIASITFVYTFIFLFYAILGVLTGASGAASQMKTDFFMILRKMALGELFRWDKTKAQAERPQGFLMNCFAYLFGDGDPNSDLETRKWKLLAQTIRENEGVVTAEMLAPYYGRNPDGDKDFLGVLARFDGTAILTDGGYIVYVFPSLMTPAKELQDILPPCLEERTWHFTSLPKEQMMGVYLMVALNLLGSGIMFWYWCRLLPEKQWSGGPLVLYVLANYGLLFLLIPLSRLVVQHFLNARVRERNAVYNAYAFLLTQRNRTLTEKLLDAEQVRISEGRMRNSRIAYTTELDCLEQELS